MKYAADNKKPGQFIGRVFLWNTGTCQRCVVNIQIEAAIHAPLIPIPMQMIDNQRSQSVRGRIAIGRITGNTSSVTDRCSCSCAHSFNMVHLAAGDHRTDGNGRLCAGLHTENAEGRGQVAFDRSQSDT